MASLLSSTDLTVYPLDRWQWNFLWVPKKSTTQNNYTKIFLQFLSGWNGRRYWGMISFWMSCRFRTFRYFWSWNHLVFTKDNFACRIKRNKKSQGYLEDAYLWSHKSYSRSSISQKKIIYTRFKLSKIFSLCNLVPSAKCLSVVSKNSFVHSCTYRCHDDDTTNVELRSNESHTQIAQF